MCMYVWEKGLLTKTGLGLFSFFITPFMFLDLLLNEKKGI